MAQFNKLKVEMFLGVVRKYMQVRGSINQKELAELTHTGVSTMSRFLNQQTKELNAQLISKIVAKLNVPLHEIIDFVDESYADQFIRLVKFHKADEGPLGEYEKDNPAVASNDILFEDSMAKTLAPREGDGESKRPTTAKIRVGGKVNTISFGSENKADSTIRDKLENLTARQKGFLNDFLGLDNDGRDLVVDIGKNIISYLRQKGIDF